MKKAETSLVLLTSKKYVKQSQIRIILHTCRYERKVLRKTF